MHETAWDEATHADALLLDLRKALEAEVIAKEDKAKLVAGYNKRINLEAELPSCSCCGIRSYPFKGGEEAPLTRPEPLKQSENQRAKQSFVVLPISDPRFEALKVTPEQKEANRTTRQYRTVYHHNRTDYHLYPRLVLPTAPVAGPVFVPDPFAPSALRAKEAAAGQHDSAPVLPTDRPVFVPDPVPTAPSASAHPSPEPHVVLCSACYGRLAKNPSAAKGPSQSDDVSAGPGGAQDDGKPPPLPYNCVAAGHEYGQLQGLPALSLIDTAILAKVIPYGTILKLKEWKGASQRAMTGQIICFPSDGPEAAADFEASRAMTCFPFHSNETLAEHVKVSFVGPTGKAKDYIKILMMPDGPLFFNVNSILAWLRVLRQTHPFYADIVVPSEEDLQATLAPLHDLIVRQAQVVDDDTARFMENAKIGQDIAGVRDIFVRSEDQDDAAQQQPVSDPHQDRDENAAEADTAPDGVHLNPAGIPEKLPLIMSDVVIIDSSRSEEDTDQLLLDALNATMRKPSPEDSSNQSQTEGLFCRRSEEPVNDVANSDQLLVCAFPHIFPFGVGVPKDPVNPKFTRYLMLHSSNSFANEPRLYFQLFNQLHRKTHFRSTSLRVKAQKKHIDAVTRITKQPDFMVRLEAATANPASADAKKLVGSLHPHIITLGAKTPYSPAARAASFNHMLAGMNRFRRFDILCSTPSPYQAISYKS